MRQQASKIIWSLIKQHFIYLRDPTRTIEGRKTVHTNKSKTKASMIILYPKKDKTYQA